MRSAFDCGIGYLLLSITEKEGAVIIQDSCRRYLQRALATKSYYGSLAGRYDSAMVSAETSNSHSPNNERKDKNKVWLGYLLAFFRFVKRLEKETSARCTNAGHVQCVNLIR